MVRKDKLGLGEKKIAVVPALHHKHLDLLVGRSNHDISFSFSLQGSRVKQLIHASTSKISISIQIPVVPDDFCAVSSSLSSSFCASVPCATCGSTRRGRDRRNY